MRSSKKEREFQEKCRKEVLDAQTNMKYFWDVHGRETINKFSKRIKCWPRKEEKQKGSKAILQSKLECSPILLITANRVEANMMVRCLSDVSRENGGELLTITDEGGKFHFGTIAGMNVVHVQPKDMSSFTRDGSFSTIESILKHYKPRLVVSVGVAFGADAQKQNLGDVIVSKRLFPYDSSNKYSDGSIKLNGSLYETNSQLLCSWIDLLEYEKFPGMQVINDEDKTKADSGANGEADKNEYSFETKEFNWYSGTVLSGGSVVDEVEQKVKLFTAAENGGIDDVVGGEMEGSGIYFACDKEKIPCIVVKGICDWGVNKNAWDEILKSEENPPDNKTVKDCIQALAFLNAFTALRCLLEYDNTMISENSGMQDVADVPTTNLFNMKSIKRRMMKFSTINFPPYLFLGTVYILISFLYEPILFKLFNNEFSTQDLGNATWWSLIILVITLVITRGLAVYSRSVRRYTIKHTILEAFPIIIFLEVNVFLFFVTSYIKIFIEASSMKTGNIINCFTFVYGGFLYIGAIVWIIAKHIRVRPENLKLVFADIVIKNLSFEKCCCIIENISKVELYSMSIGWICKTQLSPVKIHRHGTLSSQRSLLITSQKCIHNPRDIQVFKMPEDFCSIVPDTLQINYRMPSGDLVVHIITKAPREITKRESSETDDFCTRYFERILIYRDKVYEEVLKRICYSQKITGITEINYDASGV